LRLSAGRIFTEALNQPPARGYQQEQTPDRLPERDTTMRKVIFLSGAIVIAAAAVFAWSHTVLVSPHAGTVGLRTADSAMISPTEMMINRQGETRTEQWDAF
jgi:hypothetical protein